MSSQAELDNMVAQAKCFAAETERNMILELYSEKMRPFMLLQPRLFIDGNKWCALYGDNLQDGVAGFGDSPRAASYKFDEEWAKSLPVKSGCPDCAHPHTEGARLHPNKHSDTSACPKCGSAAAPVEVIMTADPCRGQHRACLGCDALRAKRAAQTVACDNCQREVPASEIRHAFVAGGETAQCLACLGRTSDDTGGDAA